MGGEGGQKRERRGFSDGPVLENLPSNEGAVGSTLSWGTKIPNDPWLLNLSTTTKNLGIKEEPTVKTQKQRGRLRHGNQLHSKVKSRARVKEGHVPTGIREWEGE